MTIIKAKIIKTILSAILVSLFIQLPANAGDPMQGGSIYSKHCSGCHGGNGIGIIAGTPNLAGNTQLMVRPDFELVNTIQMGKGIMPAFRGRLTESEIRNVIAHIRTFF